MAKRRYPDEEIPTPEEIKEREERAAEIRRGWSPAEMARRAGAWGRCEVRQYEFDGRDTAFKLIEYCW
jgi:hypothetical protein